MQVANPISMTRVHDYIVVVSLLSRECSWFNVSNWDTLGTAPVGSVAISPFIVPSGITGYSPKNAPDTNYAYIWNSVSTGGPDIFQLDLDTATITRCNIISPHTTDIFIDYDNDFHNDRAYAVSSTLSGSASDFISMFEPYKTAQQIQSLTEIFMQPSSGAYKIVANDDYFFTSLLYLKGLAIFNPNISSGNENHFVEHIMEHDTKFSRFLATDNQTLVFSGREPDTSFTLSFMDVNFWNDFPYMEPFAITKNYNVTSTQIFDVEIINGKLFAIIGNEIYIIDLIDKED
jgi:hypothetical protein